MKFTYRNIALTARTDFEGKEQTLQQIVQIVEKMGGSVHVDPKQCNVPILKNHKRYQSFKGFDLIIVAGGDGTILRTVKEMQDFRIPLLTINKGTLGFLTECDTDECEEALPKFLQGEGYIEERNMLTCSVERENGKVIKGHALNEVVISQGAIARLIELKTSVNNKPLTTFRADGIIISTPTGSTAYNLAAGGPILHPRSCDTIITPINAHTLSKKPLAVPSETVIDVEIIHRAPSGNNLNISLTFDGQTHHELHHYDNVRVTKHSETIRFLRRSEDTFYKTLREKLGWGE